MRVLLCGSITPKKINGIGLEDIKELAHDIKKGDLDYTKDAESVQDGLGLVVEVRNHKQFGKLLEIASTYGVSLAIKRPERLLGI